MSTEPQPPLTPEALATWTDQELIDEWSKTPWFSDDPWMSVLAAEIERRGLDY